MIKSVSDKKIVENHVNIIREMIDEYNEAMEFDFGEELQYPDLPNWALVQKLLLYGTTHGGMGSSIKKCEEIEIDP